MQEINVGLGVSKNIITNETDVTYFWRCPVCNTYNENKNSSETECSICNTKFKIDESRYMYIRGN